MWMNCTSMIVSEGAGPSKSNESCSVTAEEQYSYVEVILVKNGGRKADYEMKCRKTAGGTSTATGQDGNGPTYSTIPEMIEGKF